MLAYTADGVQFFVEIGKFGVPYFHAFAKDFHESLACLLRST